MYQTSNEYKSKIYLSSTRHLLKIYINGTQIDKKYILDCKRSQTLFNNEEFSLGSVTSQGIELKLYKSAVPATIESIYIVSGIEGEEVPIGYFNVDNVSRDDDYTVTLKLLDNMIKFEFNYDGSALVNQRGYAEIIEVLQEICSRAGVELGSTSFLNMHKQIAVYDNTVSARTYLSYIAEQAGGFACIGRDGKLYIRTIGENIAELPLRYFQNFKWGDKFIVTRVRYDDGLQLFEKGNREGNTIYINQENMYIVDHQQIDNIYELLNGLEVYSFEGSSIIDPAIDVGDILIIDGKKVIYQGSCQYGGKFKASISSKIQCKAKEETTTRIPSQKTINRRVQSQIDQTEGKITRLAQETSDQSEKLTRVEEDVNGVSTTISQLQNENENQTETINEIQESVNGWNQRINNSGGNNIFKYAKEFWSNGTENDNNEANLEEYSDTEIHQKSVSGLGYLLKNGTSKQTAQVKNDNYTISFTYKKVIELATGYVLINGERYNLTENDWKEETITVNINTNTIDFEMHSDTDNAFFIFDLMGNVGTEKQIWTQNPNETRTDTVTIGKGIQVNSSTTNTYTRIDSDGNRTFNSATGEVVMEATDKGVNTKQVTANTGSIGGILIQEIDGQTWISSLL